LQAVDDRLKVDIAIAERAEHAGGYCVADCDFLGDHACGEACIEVLQVVLGQESVGTGLGGVETERDRLLEHAIA
jgi:hypothetical protein